MNTQISNSRPTREILSVSQLNHRVKRLLDEHLPSLWIAGEVSNFAAPRSGHWYFTLKDEHAQVRCAMFRGRNTRSGCQIENGQQVVVRASPGLYEVRGEYQLIVDQIELAGSGALQAAFEALREKLRLEGLFDAGHKQELPVWPQVVGVVTSATGAALQDILSVMARRFPATRVLVYPSSVQGRGAAAELVRAIRTADRQQRCEVLIVSRGGGSLEDLWPFNEEIVARALYDCSLPVVSAVGHEVDFTIADFVADLRAPTPSAAAELLTPDQLEVRSELAAWTEALRDRYSAHLQRLTRQLSMLRLRLRHPKQVLQERSQHLDHLQIRLVNAQRHLLQARSGSLKHRSSRLSVASPRAALQSTRQQVQFSHARLQRSMRGHVSSRREALHSLATQLEQVSPLATLARGYAVVHDENGRLIRAAGELQRGDQLTARFAQGSADLTVTTVREKS